MKEKEDKSKKGKGGKSGNNVQTTPVIAVSPRELTAQLLGHGNNILSDSEYLVGVIKHSKTAPLPAQVDPLMDRLKKIMHTLNKSNKILN